MTDRTSLARKLNRHFKTESSEHWIRLLEAAGLPVGRVLTLAEAFADPQARHHGMLVELDHPRAGTVRTTGSPIRLDGDQARSAGVPPTLGQDTRAILHEAGLDDATINKMIEEGRAIES